MHPLVRVHDYQHNTLANIESLMEIVLSGGFNSSRGIQVILKQHSIIYCGFSLTPEPLEPIFSVKQTTPMWNLISLKCNFK